MKRLKINLLLTIEELNHLLSELKPWFAKHDINIVIDQDEKEVYYLYLEYDEYSNPQNHQMVFNFGVLIGMRYSESLLFNTDNK